MHATHRATSVQRPALEAAVAVTIPLSPPKLGPGRCLAALEAPRFFALCAVVLLFLLLGGYVVLAGSSHRRDQSSTFYGPRPFRSSRTVAARTVFERRRVRIEEHRVLLSEATAQSRGTFVDDWLFVDVADHVNVVISIARNASLLARFASAAQANGGVMAEGGVPWRGAPKLRHVSNDAKKAIHEVMSAMLAGRDDAAALGALTTLGREPPLILLFQQRKYAFEGESIAAIGGLSEPDEAPLDTARRETTEETALHCRSWHQFGGASAQYRVDANRGLGKCSSFVATDCEPTVPLSKAEQVDGGDLEGLGLVLCSLRELEATLNAEGQLADPNWAGGPCGTAPVQELKWAHTFARAILALSR